MEIAKSFLKVVVWVLTCVQVDSFFCLLMKLALIQNQIDSP